MLRFRGIVALLWCWCRSYRCPCGLIVQAWLWTALLKHRSMISPSYVTAEAIHKCIINLELSLTCCFPTCFSHLPYCHIPWLHPARAPTAARTTAAAAAAALPAGSNSAKRTSTSEACPPRPQTTTWSSSVSRECHFFITIICLSLICAGYNCMDIYDMDYWHAL